MMNVDSIVAHVKPIMGVFEEGTVSECVSARAALQRLVSASTKDSDDPFASIAPEEMYSELVSRCEEAQRQLVPHIMSNMPRDEYDSPALVGNAVFCFQSFVHGSANRSDGAIIQPENQADVHGAFHCGFVPLQT